MKNTNVSLVAMSDAAIVKRIGEFVRQTRLNQDVTQAELARLSGLNRWTIGQIENGESITLGSLIQLLRALDVLDVLSDFEFYEEISPLAYAKLKKEKGKRVRASRTKTLNKDEDLEW